MKRASNGHALPQLLKLLKRRAMMESAHFGEHHELIMGATKGYREAWIKGLCDALIDYAEGRKSLKSIRGIYNV